MRRPYKKYLRILVVVIAAGLLAVGAFNLVIDPFGAYRLINIPALNAFRSQASARIGKAEMLRHGRWDVLVFGSSRADIGVDPYDKLWGRQVVGNAALGGTNIFETIRMLKYAMKASPPRKVIFFMDFVMFDASRTCHPSFLLSRFNPDRSLVEYHLGNLLGAHALSASWQVLVDYAKSKPSRSDDRGHMAHYRTQRPGERVAPRHRFARTLRHFLLTRYRDFTYSPARMDDFRRMVRICADRGIPVIVVIPPIHAMQLEAIRLTGLWDDFERFKRDLVTVVARARQNHPSGPAIDLWDFTSYSGLNAETIPPAKDTTPMKWYWESSHFTAALGSLVLRRVLGLSIPAGIEAEDFGVRLTRANIDAHLAEIRRQRAQYARGHGRDIEMIRKLAKQAGLHLR